MAKNNRVLDFAFTKMSGTVTSVAEGSTIEDHGCIEVRLDNGDVEHYSYYDWNKFLLIVEDG